MLWGAMSIALIHKWIQWLSSTTTHLSLCSSVLALIGLGILLSIGIGYAVVYLRKAFVNILNMPVKKFIATLALTGAMLLVIAIILP